MAFVKAKKRGRKTYHYLVESYREGGRIRQRQLAYMAHFKTVREAVYGFRIFVGNRKEYMGHHRSKLAEIEQELREKFTDRGREIPKSGRGYMRSFGRRVAYYWWLRRWIPRQDQRVAIAEKALLTLEEHLTDEDREWIEAQTPVEVAMHPEKRVSKTDMVMQLLARLPEDVITLVKVEGRIYRTSVIGIEPISDSDRCNAHDLLAGVRILPPTDDARKAQHFQTGLKDVGTTSRNAQDVGPASRDLPTTNGALAQAVAS